MTKPRELKLGERIVVNLSQLGLNQACVGLVTEVTGVNGEDCAMVFVMESVGAPSDGVRHPALKRVQLLESARRDAWVPLQPGCWCSIEPLHASGGLFGI